MQLARMKRRPIDFLTVPSQSIPAARASKRAALSPGKPLPLRRRGSFMNAAAAGARRTTRNSGCGQHRRTQEHGAMASRM